MARMPTSDGKVIGPVSLVFYPGPFNGRGTWGWKHLASGQTFALPSIPPKRVPVSEAIRLAKLFAADDHSAWTSAKLTNEELKHIDEMRRK